MRILFLADAKSYHTQRWVDYFVGCGHQCYLITLDRGIKTKAEEFFIQPGILPNFLKYPFAISKIREISTQIKPDLINAHFVPSYGLVGVRLKFHPLVISTWGSDVLISPHKSWLHKLRIVYVLKKADLVTTDARFTGEAISKLGVDIGKVVVSPMGVERNLLGPVVRAEKPYLTILSNRKLEALYDVPTLLKAIPLINKEAKRRVKFVILGEGSRKKDLINMAKELGIEDSLDFKGTVSREMLIQYYRDTDIYVSTSRSDSTSVSLLEAMSFGLIPVVTDIPGNKEWIDNQKNGFLFPRSDHESLARQIVYIINEFNGWSFFRGKNQSIIHQRGTWEDNMKVIEAKFRQLIDLN